jgi:hypothetical protein
LTEVDEGFAARFTEILALLEQQDDKTSLICFGHCLEARVRSNNQAEKPVDAHSLLREAFSDSIATRWWFLLGERSSESTEVLGRVPTPRVITSLLLGGGDTSYINLKDYLSLGVINGEGSQEHWELLYNSLGAEVRIFPLEEVLSESSYQALRQEQANFLHDLSFTEGHPYASWVGYWLKSIPIRSVDEVISMVNRTESYDELKREAVLAASAEVFAEQSEKMLSRLSEIASPEARLRTLQHISKAKTGVSIPLDVYIDDEMFKFIKSDLYGAFQILGDDNFHTVVKTYRAELNIDSKVVCKYFDYLFLDPSFVETLIRNADLGEFDYYIHETLTERYAMYDSDREDRYVEERRIEEKMKDLLISRLPLQPWTNKHIDEILHPEYMSKYSGILNEKQKEVIRGRTSNYGSSHDPSDVPDTTPVGRSILVVTRIAKASRLDRQMIIEAASVLDTYLSVQTDREYPLECLNIKRNLANLGSLLQQYVSENPDIDASSFPELAAVIERVGNEITTILTTKEKQYDGYHPIEREALSEGLDPLRRSTLGMRSAPFEHVDPPSPFSLRRRRDT